MPKFLSAKVVVATISIFSSCVLQSAIAGADDRNVKELFDLTVNAVNNDVHFDQLCSSNKCNKRHGFGPEWYSINTNAGVANFYFDPTGHVIQAWVDYLPKESFSLIKASLDEMLSEGKESFQVPDEYLKNKELARYFYDKFEVILIEGRSESLTFKVDSSFESSMKRIGSLMAKEKNLQLRVKLGKGRYERTIVPGLTNIKKVKDLVVLSEHSRRFPFQGKFIIGALGGSVYTFDVSSGNNVILGWKQIASDDEPEQFEDNQRIVNETLKNNKNLVKDSAFLGSSISRYCVNGLYFLGCISWPKNGIVGPAYVEVKAPTSFIRNEEFKDARSEIKKMINDDSKKGTIPIDKNGFIDLK